MSPLYTEAEFEEARQAYIAECGYDPTVDDTMVTGWSGGGYNRVRWWWSPPWKVTRPWLPRVHLYRYGGDEWCNPTALVVLPFLGDVVVRYKPGPLRTRLQGPCTDCVAEAGHPPCPLCVQLHWPPCLPVPVQCYTCEEAFSSAQGTSEPRQHVPGRKFYCSPECERVAW